MNKYDKEKAERKKNDSDACLMQFEKDTQFGPEFVCVCCHAGLFEKQVLEFTDERKNKVGEDLKYTRGKHVYFVVAYPVFLVLSHSEFE